MTNSLVGLIFCAGKGERLMPYTKNVPKPILLKEKGKTFLELNIKKLLTLGAEHVYINYSYGLDYFTKILAKFDEQITLVYEKEPVGHGKTIFNLKNNIKNFSHLYTINGDTLADLDRNVYLRNHINEKTDFSILSDNNLAIPQNLLVDSRLNVIGCNIKNSNYFYKKPLETVNYRNGLGEYILNLQTLKFLPDNFFKEEFVGMFGENDLVEIMIKHNKTVKCIDTNVKSYISINTIEQYNKFNEENK